MQILDKQIIADRRRSATFESFKPRIDQYRAMLTEVGYTPNSADELISKRFHFSKSWIRKMRSGTSTRNETNLNSVNPKEANLEGILPNLGSLSESEGIAKAKELTPQQLAVALASKGDRGIDAWLQNKPEAKSILLQRRARNEPSRRDTPAKDPYAYRQTTAEDTEAPVCPEDHSLMIRGWVCRKCGRTIE
jgi:hypothetical protein